MNPSWSSITSKGLDLLYPPTCLHCKEGLDTHALLCTYCLQHLDLLPGEGRCSKCFQEIPQLKGTCRACRKICSPFRRFASCFEGEGPPHTLLTAFTKHGDHFLAKELASYLVIQLNHLAYPPFDAITAVPDHFSRAPKLLEKEVAGLLHLPLIHPLQRALTPEPTFSLKKRCKIVGKRLLLIGLTGETIHLAAETLREGEPETIYGITLCLK